MAIGHTTLTLAADQQVVALYDPAGSTRPTPFSIQPESFSQRFGEATLNWDEKFNFGAASLLRHSRKDYVLRSLDPGRAGISNDAIVATYTPRDQHSYGIKLDEQTFTESPLHTAGASLGHDVQKNLLALSFEQAKSALIAYKRIDTQETKEKAENALLVFKTIHRCLEEKRKDIADPHFKEDLLASLAMHSPTQLGSMVDPAQGSSVDKLCKREKLISRERPLDVGSRRDPAAARGAAPVVGSAPVVSDREFLERLCNEYLMKPKDVGIPSDLRDLARGNSEREQYIERAIAAKARYGHSDTLSFGDALKSITKGVQGAYRGACAYFSGPHDPMEIAAKYGVEGSSGSWTLAPKPVLPHDDTVLAAYVDKAGDSVADQRVRAKEIKEYTERALGFVHQICFGQALEDKGFTLEAKLTHAQAGTEDSATANLEDALDHLGAKVTPMLYRLDELYSRHAAPARGSLGKILSESTPSELLSEASAEIQKAIDAKLGPAISNVASRLTTLAPAPKKGFFDKAETPTERAERIGLSRLRNGGHADDVSRILQKYPVKQDGSSYETLLKGNEGKDALQTALRHHRLRGTLADIIRINPGDRTLANAPTQREVKGFIEKARREVNHLVVDLSRQANTEARNLVLRDLESLREELARLESATDSYPKDLSERANYFFTILTNLQNAELALGEITLLLMLDGDTGEIATLANLYEATEAFDMAEETLQAAELSLRNARRTFSAAGYWTRDSAPLTAADERFTEAVTAKTAAAGAYSEARNEFQKLQRDIQDARAHVSACLRTPRLSWMGA